MKIKVKHPVAFQWRIPENLLREFKNSIKGSLRSDEFLVPDTNIRNSLFIFPNGDSEEHRGQTWIMLENGEHESEFFIFIESSNTFKSFLATPYSKTGTKLCTIEELFDPENRYFIDGELNITVDGYFMVEKIEKSCKLGEAADTVCTDLWNQDIKDFTIIADGQEITAHKLILSTRSQVFAAMFQFHTIEAQENRVVIPDFPYHIVDIGIKLCYHSSLVPEIPIEDQILLLQFFDKYDIQSLKNELEKCMIAEIDEFNVCHFTNASIVSNAPTLQAKCVEFLQIRLKNSMPVSDFEILDKDFCFDMMRTTFSNNNTV